MAKITNYPTCASNGRKADNENNATNSNEADTTNNTAGTKRTRDDDEEGEGLQRSQEEKRLRRLEARREAAPYLSPNVASGLQSVTLKALEARRARTKARLQARPDSEPTRQSSNETTRSNETTPEGSKETEAKRRDKTEAALAVEHGLRKIMKQPSFKEAIYRYSWFTNAFPTDEEIRKNMLKPFETAREELGRDDKWSDRALEKAIITPTQ